MSLADKDRPDHGGDDMLAAEYVVGVLPADERREATRRIDSETGFARLVDQWEQRLAPLADAYVPVEAPAGIKPAVDARLFSARSAAAGPGLWRNLAFWRSLAAAATLALAVAIAVPMLQPPAPAERLVASLSAPATDVHYFVVYDSRTHDVGLSHVTGARAEGRDFELWVIEGQNPPLSLGVIPVGANVHLAVSQALRDRIESGAVFAISLEPRGGSPTGKPTGPVVASGDLKTI